MTGTKPLHRYSCSYALLERDIPMIPESCWTVWIRYIQMRFIQQGGNGLSRCKYRRDRYSTRAWKTSNFTVYVLFRIASVAH